MNNRRLPSSLSQSSSPGRPTNSSCVQTDRGVWHHNCLFKTISRHAVTSLYFVDHMHMLGVLFWFVFFVYKKKLLCCDLLICPDCYSHLSVCLPCLQFSALPFATLCSLVRASFKKICQKNPIRVSYMCFLSEHRLQSKDK